MTGSGQIIDGKAHAARLRADIAQAVIARASAGARAPALAVVLVGDDPASHVYVRNKTAACREAGITSIEHRRDATLPEAELLALVQQLNRDPAVDGILVQLPLPAHIDSARIISAISPDKDVDGFSPVNAGRLATGLDGFVPCTPLGCLRLLQLTLGDISGAEAIVIGRSNIVGRPMASLLIGASATAPPSRLVRMMSTASCCVPVMGPMVPRAAPAPHAGGTRVAPALRCRTGATVRSGAGGTQSSSG